MLKKYFMLLAVILLLSGCYEDKGNYDYIDIIETKISNIEDTYTAYVGEKLVIQPNVEITNGENSKIEYQWRINGEVVSIEKDLDVIVNQRVKKGIYCDFSVKDIQTEIIEMKTFKIDVVSQFQTGWLILADNGDKSQLCYMREDGVFYQDIYNSINNEYLSEDPVQIKEHWLPWSSELGQVFVACKGAPGYSVELDGASFKKMVNTKDEFVGDNTPSDFSPVNADYVSGWDYLISAGKLYTRNIISGFDAQYQEESYSPYPVAGDYELSEWTMRGNVIFGTLIIGFDNATSSYIQVKNGGIKQFDYVNDPNKHFEPSNMNLDILAGAATSTGFSTDRFLTILKDKDNGDIHLHKFLFSGWSNKKYYSTHDTTFTQKELILSDSKFAICKNRPYVYFTSGGKLYQYNHDEYSDPILLRDFGENTIKEIAINTVTNEQLGVAVSTGSGKCDFLILDVSIAGAGATIEEHKDKCGEVVDILYKIGDQWRLY